MSVIMDLAAKFTLDSSELEKGINGAHTSVGSLGDTFKTFGKIAAAAFAAATTAVVAFGTKSVEVGKGFDKSMSQVLATMGATLEQLNATEEDLAKMSDDERQSAIKMQTEYQALRDFAQEMGRTTVFSATQAADALNYMALAGYDADKSMAMLPNVLNLAASGSMELATASDMITDAETALGLNTEQVNAMVDQMARTASKSNTSVSQLGEALLTIGGTAKFMTGGTKELNTVLGVLADNGIKGSEAGTKLRNMVLKLAKPTKEGANALAQLGVSVFDAEGNMRSFTEIFPEMREGLSKLSSAEQVNLLGGLFNTRDVAAAQALINTSVERWEQLGDAIEESAGAAQAMADVQLDNLEGDVTLFESAMEGLQIAVSDSLTPMYRDFVQFGSKSISSLTEGFKKGGLTGAMEAFGTILSDGLAMLNEKLPVMIEAGGKLLMAFVKGFIDNVPNFMSASVQIITVLLTMIRDNLPSLISSGIQAVGAIIKGIGESIPKLIPIAIDIIFELVDTLVENLPTLVPVGVNAILAIITGIVEAVPELLQKAPEIIGDVLDALLNSLPVIIEAGIKLISTLITGIIDALPTLITYVPTIIITILTTLLANLPMLIEAGLKMIPQIIVGIAKAIPSLIAMVPQIILQLVTAIVQGAVRLVEAGRELVQKVKEGFKQKIEDAKQWGKDLIQNFKDGITKKWESLKNGIKSIGQGIKNLLGFSEPKEGPLSDFHTYAPDMMQLFAKGIKDNEDVVYNQLRKSFDFEDQLNSGFNFSVNRSGANGRTVDESLPPIKIVVQSVLDKRIVGEASYTYIKGRTRAGELAWV